MLNAQPPKLSNVPAVLQLYKQFILWKFVIRANGKRDKVPCDVYGNPINHLDPANWLTAADAMQLQHRGAFGVGFVFTKGDPFFFIDLDNCFAHGQLTPGAREIVDLFPGAWFERSQSGGGVHIIASADQIAHGTRGEYFSQKVELYTGDRFAALTGIEAQGDPAIVHSQALAMLIEGAGLRPKPIATPGPVAALSPPGPRPDATAPADDNELVTLARDSKGSGAVMFGGGVRFWDLWTANAPALARRWPDTRPGRTFGWSEADNALIAQLEFWTGKDRERVARLFKQSALYRPEKYEGKGAYLLDRMLDWAGDYIKSYYNFDPKKVPIPTQKLPGGVVVPVTTLDYGEHGLTMKALLAGNYPKPVELVTDLLFPGVYVLAGKPKEGKSWMVLDLSLSVADGGYFLEKKCRKGDVIYFALEDNRRRMKDRIMKLADRNFIGESPNLRILTLEDDVKGYDEGFVLSLEKTLALNPNMALISIDTMAKVAPLRRSTETLYQADRRLLDALGSICSRYPKLTVILVHHTRKAESDDPFELISGTNGVFGACDGCFVLAQSSDTGGHILHSKSREMDTVKMNVKLIMPKWEVVNDPGMNDNKVLIFNLLKTQPGLTMTQICNELDMSKQNVQKWLGQMVRDGQLMKEAKSYYPKTT